MLVLQFSRNWLLHNILETCDNVATWLYVQDKLQLSYINFHIVGKLYIHETFLFFSLKKPCASKNYISGSYDGLSMF